MSTDPAILLKMLEPAVRPGPTSGGPAKAQGRAPFEQQPFDQLLKQAQQQPVDAQQSAGADQSAGRPDPLQALADASRIENPTLRLVLAQQQQPRG